MSLQDVQVEEFNLLVRLKEFLENRGLRYTLHAGTLLGAVRHKGFIPWDDDIDIAMPRPDYEIFRSIADELPEDLFFIHDANSDFSLRFGKVCTTKIRAQQKETEGILKDYLWIDIFPIDGLPRLQKDQNTLFKRVLRNRQMRLYLTMDSRLTSNKWKALIVNIYKLLPFKQWRRERLDAHFIKLINENPYEESEYITTSLASNSNCLWVGQKNEFCNWEKAIFNGVLFTVYSNKEHLLFMGYGDYMQVPPENERPAPRMKCWRVE